mgnify:CR=1 FL=1
MSVDGQELEQLVEHVAKELSESDAGIYPSEESKRASTREQYDRIYMDKLRFIASIAVTSVKDYEEQNSKTPNQQELEELRYKTYRMQMGLNTVKSLLLYAQSKIGDGSVSLYELSKLLHVQQEIIDKESGDAR